jgi:hypothetical protein
MWGKSDLSLYPYQIIGAHLKVSDVLIKDKSKKD